MLVIVLLFVSAALTGWVALDAARHGRSWYVWSRIVFLTGIFGAAAWLFIRRREAPAVSLPPWRRVVLLLAGVPLLIAGLAIVIATRTFGYQFATIEGVAMEPTLMNGERVLVNKWTYLVREPQIGDVVMLRYPNNPEKFFVKRLIAAEGDAVRIVDGKVYRNDVLMDDSYVAPESRSHDHWGPEVIPEGYYFVMGDKRNNSSDSRHWRWVPKKYIVGRLSK